MLHSFVNLLHAPLGFNPTDIIAAKVPFNFAKFPETQQRSALMRQILDQVRAIPGVESVSAADPLPLDGQQTRRVGTPDQPNAEPLLATQQGALPGYLQVVGTNLLKGRDFTNTDILASPQRVTIIDERLATQLWPAGNALGRQLVVYRTGHQHVMEVVGITTAVRATQVRDDAVPHFMMPDDYPQSLVIKTHQTAAQITPALNRAVAAAHTGRPPSDIFPLSDSVSNSMGDTRFILLVLSAFAAVSVLLAAVGLYGTLSYLTTQRTREFGIRLALGSSVESIIAIVVKEGILLAIVGTAIGLVGVAAVTSSIREMLYEVRPLDAITLVSVIVLVALVALIAACIPAWRVTRIDPQTALRSE
jgi:predicted permease